MRLIPIALLIVASSSAMAAPCYDSPESQQWVIAGNSAEHLDAWKVDSKEIHALSLSNGFKFGVKVNPVSDQHYRKLLEGQTSVPELVEITLFDLTGDSPKEIAHTYGGSNSIQGYSSNGGATTVEEFGPAGVRLFMQKTSCVTLESLASK